MHPNTSQEYALNHRFRLVSQIWDTNVSYLQKSAHVWRPFRDIRMNFETNVLTSSPSPSARSLRRTHTCVSRSCFRFPSKFTLQYFRTECFPASIENRSQIALATIATLAVGGESQSDLETLAPKHMRYPHGAAPDWGTGIFLLSVKRPKEQQQTPFIQKRQTTK